MTRGPAAEQRGGRSVRGEVAASRPRRPGDPQANGGSPFCGSPFLCPARPYAPREASPAPWVPLLASGSPPRRARSLERTPRDSSRRLEARRGRPASSTRSSCPASVATTSRKWASETRLATGPDRTCARPPTPDGSRPLMPRRSLARSEDTSSASPVASASPRQSRTPGCPPAGRTGRCRTARPPRPGAVPEA